MAAGYKTGGRQPGARNKASYGVRELASEYGADALKELHRLSTEAASDQARVSACKAILDRAYGTPTPGQPITVDLPDMTTAQGVVAAVIAIARATASGDITPSEARDLTSIIEVQRKAIETSELAERMARIEEAIKERRP